MKQKTLLSNICSLAMAVILFIGTSLSASAQNVTTKGVITDESGEPVLGAAIVVAGTSNGTTSDLDGSFSITAPKGATVEVSCIGYSTVTFIAGEQPEVKITLHEDNEFLEETIVIGYSVQKKSNVTGAIASVKSDDLANRSTENAGQALQGKLAGLQVLTNSSAPGASTTFRIRGYSSTSGSSNPLYLVDGLKVSNIDYLDSESIASIEILKDAASAAIYGAEAGNGVVLITTKDGGQKGTSRIFYNNQLSFTSQARKIEMMGSEHFKDYWKTAGKVNNDNVFGTANTDWQDEMLETGFMQKHTVGVQGANNNGSFYVSLSYQGQDGIVLKDKDTNKHLTAQVNADYKIRPWLKVGTTNSIERRETISITEQANHGGAAQAIIYYDPTVPIEYSDNSQAPASLIQAMNDGNRVFYGPNGNLLGVSQVMTSSIYNPYIMLEYRDSKSWATNVNGTLYADLTPIKNLVFTTKLGYRIGQTFSNNYTSPYYLTPKQVSSAPSLTSRNSNSFYYQWENYANYNKSFGKHDIAVMAGMQYADTRSEFVSGTTNELTSLDPNYLYLDYTVATATTRTLGGSYYNRRNISYFGRLGYTYDNRYMVQVNFRADAFDSSKLSQSNRWGYFPSVSFGWTASNEKWMKNIDKKALSFLKIRGSWGINGNVNSLSGYPYTAAMEIGPRGNNLMSSVVYYNFDNKGLQIGTAPSTILANPNLTWEESRQVDAGVDMRFLNNKLSLTYDFYYKRTTNMLGTISAPYISGCSTQTVNAGKIDNWGHELELSYKDSIGELNYRLDFNASTVKNIVRESPYEDGRYYNTANDEGYQTVIEAGYPMWYLRLFELDHVDPQTGLNVYGDGETEGDAADGRIAYTNIYPKLSYGLTLTLNYKNWDMVIFGNGVQGVDKYLNIYHQSEPMINLPEFIYQDTFRPGNTNAKYGIPSSVDTKYSASDQWVFDASYFRIKQMQLGYSLNSKLLKKTGLQGLRVFCSLEDFFTFTKYPGDPESRSNYGRLMSVDNIAYPQTKRVLLGVNVSF